MVYTGSYTFSFDYVNATQVIALGSILPALCFLFVILRGASRWKQKAGLGSDDFFIGLGAIFVTGMGISLIAGAAQGAMGYDTPPVPAYLTEKEKLFYTDAKSVIVNKVEFAFQILMILAYGSIKLSITLFYRRVFVAHTGTVFDYLSKTVFVIIALWTLTFTLIMTFECGGHFEAVWGSRYEQSLYCKTLASSSEYSMAISDLILDLVVILMPLPLVWRLNISIEKRIAITGILLLGASAVGASVARLVLYLQILDAEKNGVVFDSNQNITISMWWSLLEAGLALIAACLPTLTSLRPSKSLRSKARRVWSHLSLSSHQTERHTSQETLAESQFVSYT